MGRAGLSVVVPTYGREGVLVETIAHVLALEPPPEEILVVDQTPEHEVATATALSAWHRSGAIRWIVLERPSIAAAMNVGLKAASCATVLFLDDDLLPAPMLVGAHAAAHGDPAVGAVSGQVLQPGEVPAEHPLGNRKSGRLEEDLDFKFCAVSPADVANVMAGNLSVKRSAALAIGGFDERFLGQAYRFETEFARRLRRAGWVVRFEPRASIRHLKAPTGGVRQKGSDLKLATPDASVGDYYFALLEGRGWDRWRYVLRRPLRSVRTRFHLRNPWWIPVKLIGEGRGFALAWRLFRERRRERPREGQTVSTLDRRAPS